MGYKTEASAKAQLTRQVNAGLLRKDAYEVFGCKLTGYYIREKK